jgi:hypothetical protein
MVGRWRRPFKAIESALQPGKQARVQGLRDDEVSGLAQLLVPPWITVTNHRLTH